MEFEQTSPTFSPDGAKIAFQDGGSGGALYVMNADGSGKKVLTDPATGEPISGSDPDWQPLSGRSVPQSGADCKNGGYREFNFKNQGRCLSFVRRAA
jgi:Tol biopolymer transport system component